MKKTNYILLAIALSLILSCSNDESEKEIAPEGSMIAKIEGSSWKSEQAAAVIFNDAISIVGTDGDDNGIELSVLTSNVAGTYMVKGTETSLPDALVSYTPSGEIAYFSSYFPEAVTVGKMIITEIDEVNKTISGTFECKVKRLVPEEKELEIKEGSFTRIPYTSDASAPTDNTFSAKVDGINFGATIIGGVKAFNTITLNATNGTKGIAISLPATVTTGSHNFGGISDDYYATYLSGSTYYQSTSGSVNITKHDTAAKLIEGTFSFAAELFPAGGGSVSVTAGAFSISY